MNLLLQALPWLVFGASVIGFVLGLRWLQGQVDEKQDWWKE